MSSKISVVFFILLFLTAIAGADDSREFSLQDSHQEISDELVRLADKIDQIFGEPRATDQVNRTSLRLATYYDWTGRGGDGKGTEVRLNLRLPILERESRTVTDQFFYDNQKKSANSTPLVQTQKPIVSLTPVTKSVAERIQERRQWHIRAEPGVRIGHYFSFFEKARATKSFFTGNFVHNFSQEVSWDSAVMWEESTLIENDFALNEKLLFRLNNQGDWQITDTHFHSYHGISFIQQLGLLSGISYNAKLMSQIEDARWYADTYTLSVNYRRAVYSNWAFLELVPALLFQKEQRFKGMTNFTARLEFLFGAI